MNNIINLGKENNDGTATLGRIIMDSKSTCHVWIGILDNGNLNILEMTEEISNEEAMDILAKHGLAEEVTE